jgi:hypothetical protein
MRKLINSIIHGILYRTNKQYRTRYDDNVRFARIISVSNSIFVK